MNRQTEDALRALLHACEQRAVVTAVQHHASAEAKQVFLRARQGAKQVLNEVRELGHLRDLAMAGMSSLSRVGRLGKRDSQRLCELEEKYGRG